MVPNPNQVSSGICSIFRRYIVCAHVRVRIVMVRQHARVNVDAIGMIRCFVMRNLRERLVDVLYVGGLIPVEVYLICHQYI